MNNSNSNQYKTKAEKLERIKILKLRVQTRSSRKPLPKWTEELERLENDVKNGIHDESDHNHDSNRNSTFLGRMSISLPHKEGANGMAMRIHPKRNQNHNNSDNDGKCNGNL